MAGLPLRHIGAAACALLALVAAGCGSSDDSNSSTKITTRPNPGTAGNAPVRITYVADSPYGDKITSAQMSDALATLGRRAKLLGLHDTTARSRGSDRVVITYSPEDFIKSGNSQLPAQGRVFFYDFNADVVGNADKPIGDIYFAVTTASQRKPVRNRDNTTGNQFYLFGGVRNYRGGPTGSTKSLLAKFNGDVPESSTVKTVPPGTIVVLAQVLAEALSAKQFNGDYVLRDRPQLDNADIADPKIAKGTAPGLDGKPVLAFQLTPAGQTKFEQLAQQISRAGGGQFAVVLDGQVLSKTQAPAPDSASIDAGFEVPLGARAASDLAAVLQSGPLPFRLIPVLQEQVQDG